MISNKILVLLIILFSILLVGILLIVFVFNNSEEKANAVCSCNVDLDCTDFATQVEAQQCFEYCGGTGNDFHRLDSDGNGLACEGLE